jgi:hypothetical protein
MSSSSKRKELGNPTPVLMILLLVVLLPLNSVKLFSFQIGELFDLDVPEVSTNPNGL